MTDRLERNKQDATGFYNLMFNQCKPAEAVSKFLGDVYIQQNPHAADGKIVEHWDILQVVPEKSAISNTMF